MTRLLWPIAYIIILPGLLLAMVAYRIDERRNGTRLIREYSK